MPSEPKKGDLVPQPTIGEEWFIRFITTHAAKGWQDLENTAWVEYASPKHPKETE